MNHYLMSGLANGPKAVRQLASSIGDAKLSQSLGDGRFTGHEEIAHLADWEPILRHRISMGASEPGWDVIVYDEGERSIEIGYAAMDLEIALATLETERAKTMTLFDGLTPAQWKHTMNHPEHGEISVYDYANMMVGHDMYHIEHLTQYLS